MKKLLVSVIALFGAVSLSAQDVTAIYNEAAAAFGAKNFTEAAAKFEQVIDQGMDNESAASMVATAKSTLPKCYFMLGGGALKTKNYDEALKNFEKSAELAELYGDMNQMAKSNGWVAKIYQIQGGDAFNNKDYATASEIFAKGYAADPDNTGMALNLAMSYCEMAMSSGDMSQYEKGMEIYEAVAAKTHPKYAEDAAKAKEDMALYTNNMVAKMQAANDFDGIIKMADDLLAKNPQSALAQNVRLQAYANKKDYAKVIEDAKAAIEAAKTPEEVDEILAAAREALKTAGCPSTNFTDVEENGWYHTGVDFMVRNGFMNGVADDAFDVDGNLTRAQLVTILYRIAGEPESTATNPFADVADGQWYTNAVIWAAENGIVKGVNTTTFAPNDQITREQIATILFRYAKAEKVEGKLAGFPDAGEVSDYAADAMAWAVEQGLINGISESDGKTYLAPQETATRAQIAVILMRYLTAEN